MPADPTPKKTLGQHWLYDAQALAAMCRAAAIVPGDSVLEIGPGHGTLTAHLLAAGANVTAVELDSHLAQNLPQIIPEPARNPHKQDEPFRGELNPHKQDGPFCGELTVVEQDILRFDFSRLKSPYKVVANIPYYLTNHLLRLLSTTPNPPITAALLVQKEVAERVAAAPGEMSVLSVTTQLYWQVSLGLVVAAELFTPPPKVDSQILILQRRPEPLYAIANTADFFRLVKAGFSQRRKTLENTLSAGLRITKSQTREMLESAGIPASTRAQALSLNDWHRLYRITTEK